MINKSVARELAEYEQAWEQSGYFPAVIEAFRLCAVTEHPIPQWLAESVNAALVFTLQEGGRDGKKGKRGGYFPQAKRSEVDEWRWGVARQYLQTRALLPLWGNYRPTRIGAFEYTADQLKGTLAEGSPEAIEDSYNKVQRRKRIRPA